MKITIDTQTDSHEDIKKVLYILSNIIQNKDSSIGPVRSVRPIRQTEIADTTNMMSMFNTSTSSEPTSNELKKETSGTPPDFSNFMNLMNKKEGVVKEETTEEEHKIQFF